MPCATWPERHDCDLLPVRPPWNPSQRRALGAFPAATPWCVQCETGAPVCARACACGTCPSVPTGASACARSDCSLRVSNPKLPLGISPTAYSGISARIAALSALQATMEASFCRAASANSPLVRTAARSARGQSIRSDAGTPTSLMRSTICGPFEGVAHAVRDRAISPASIGA